MAALNDPGSLPRWADQTVANGPTGGDNVVEPPTAKKDRGWDYEEFPPRNWFNWILRQIYAWIDFLNNAQVPVGGIIMFNGTIAAIPDGWELCDGANGTPDLTGRFVVHADADSGGTYNPGDTGGSNDHSHTVTVNSAGAHTHAVTVNSAGAHSHSGSANSAGSHSHTITVNPTTLSASQGPTHQHEEGTVHRGDAAGFHTRVYGTSATSQSGNINEHGQFRTDGARGFTSFVTGGSGSHTHTASSNSTGAHTHTLSINSDGSHSHTGSTASDGAHVHTASSGTTDNRPPYYALAFIMRIAPV